MRPALALEMMAVLRDRLSLPIYAQYMDYFQMDVAMKDNGITIRDATGRPSGWHFCQREIKRLNMAETYFVAKDMTPVVSWMANSLDDSDAFRHDLWPSDYGFLVLEDALLSRDARGRQMTTKALSWGRTPAGGKPGTQVTYYSDLDDHRDETSVHLMQGPTAKMTATAGRLQVSHMIWIPDGGQVGPAVITPQMMNQYDQPGIIEDVLDPAAYAFAIIPLADADNDQRFLLSLLMLLGQTLASVTAEDLDRQSSKRYRRMGLPQQITVIQLRRTEGSRREGETLVEWHHRWITRAHWRWQAYGRPQEDHAHVMSDPVAEAGRLVRVCETIGCDRHWERIAIAPFIKGPADRPLVITEKVQALVR